MEYEILYFDNGYKVKKAFLHKENEAKEHVPKGCKIIEIRIFSWDNYL